VLPSLSGFGFGAAKHIPQPRQDSNVTHIPAVPLARGVDLLPKLDPRLDRPLRREDDVSVWPARSIPAGDEPACASTGWPCGGRGTDNAPAME